MLSDYRLDLIQKKALKYALKNLHSDEAVFLFGSRTDLSQRGGDIDILIYSQRGSFELSRQITREFFKQCEEKIDVLVVNPQKTTAEQDLFIASINKISLARRLG